MVPLQPAVPVQQSTDGQVPAQKKTSASSNSLTSNTNESKNIPVKKEPNDKDSSQQGDDLAAEAVSSSDSINYNAEGKKLMGYISKWGLNPPPQV